MTHRLLTILKKRTTTASGEPALSSASFAKQNTTATNDLGPDGYGWSQSYPITVDQYGKIISVVQVNNGGTRVHKLIWSNNDGVSWTDNSFDEGFLARPSIAIDTTNDVLHILWTAGAATDGVIYRRYTISRSGNNISAITKDAAVNLQLDFQGAGTMQYEHPVMLWMNDAAFGTYGAIVAVWSCRNTGTGGTGNEVRSSMCVLGSTADRGKTAGNWVAVTTSSASTIGNAPAVTYSALLTNATGAVIYPSIARKTSGTNAKDLYLFYHDGGSTADAVWAFRRVRWSAANNDWRTGLTSATTITNVQRAGGDTGYTLKQQLGSKPCEDTTNDRMYFGFATWKSNASGDTWGFAYIDSADAISSLVDVYSASGIHSYAPCGDIAFDNTARRLVVSYIKTGAGTEYAYVRLYNGTTATSNEITAYTDEPVDIPLLYSRSNGKLLVLFRVTTGTPTPPYDGVFGTLTWG